MVGEDVGITVVTSGFAIGKTEETPLPLITRRLSRGVVANLFADAHSGSHREIVGSRGIGKSWALIYALQQVLMYNGAFVVVITQVEHLVCSHHKNKIFVWRSDTMGTNPFGASNILHKSEQVLVLLDPEQDGAKIVNGARRLIYAA
jgi:hypothetical protein